MKPLNKLPPIEETRKAIDRMPIKDPEDRIFKNAFKYLFLIAGRLKEVYGSYSPIGNDSILTTIHGEEAIIFPVKTARRQGYRRAVALPLKFEPWAEKLHLFFRESPNSNPFDLPDQDNRDTAKKYLQTKALEVFKDHEMKRLSYNRTRYVSPKELNAKIIEDKGEGKKRYLIEFEDKSRNWFETPKIKITKTVPEKWKKFTCQHLREQRIRELDTKYKFDDLQMRVFTGLKQSSKVSPLIEWPSNEPINEYIIEKLKEQADTYFTKLLV